MRKSNNLPYVTITPRSQDGVIGESYFVELYHNKAKDLQWLRIYFISKCLDSNTSTAVFTSPAVYLCYDFGNPNVQVIFRGSDEEILDLTLDKLCRLWFGISLNSFQNDTRNFVDMKKSIDNLRFTAYNTGRSQFIISDVGHVYGTIYCQSTKFER